MNTSKLRDFIEESTELFRSLPSLTVSIFIAATIIMNLLANKSMNVPFSWLALDCGFIVSWLVFLILDIVTRHYGPRAATMLTVGGIAVNLFFCLILYAGSRIPGVWGESFVEGSEDVINAALNHTFGGTSYVLLGSSIAFFVSSVVNNFTNWYIGVTLRKKREASFGTYAARTYVSTAIGQFVDNLVFALLVSHRFFGWSLTQCITCAITGAIAELLCEVVFSPIGYRISNSWQRQRVGESYITRYVMEGQR